MIAAADLTSRAEQLRAEVTAHKSAIKTHRRQLSAAKAALIALEMECRRRGIGLRWESSDGTNSPEPADDHA